MADNFVGQDLKAAVVNFPDNDKTSRFIGNRFTVFRHLMFS